MREIVRVVWLILIVSFLALPAEVPDSTPHLLLTPQRLKRLRRDRERQTTRWINFEARVRSSPDSPERGFELALYYQVTQDTASCHAANEWALHHPTEIRQVALVVDWCSAVLTPGESARLMTPPPALKITKPSFASLEDLLFASAAFGSQPKIDDKAWAAMLQQLEAQGPRALNDDELYSLTEFLNAVETSTHNDLRQSAPAFFSQLPAEILLSLKPDKIVAPGWKVHAAALAMVSLDPNLESAQFLQGWGLEDAQTIREGPGTAYEFLWADPYLPGVSYQNLEPWVYDSAGRLFARSDWGPTACWLALSSRAPEHVNCPAGWDTQVTHFGHMTLIPQTSRCVDVPRHAPGEVMILWRLQPDETLYHQQFKHKLSSQADSAGLLRLSEEIDGRLCTDTR